VSTSTFESGYDRSALARWLKPDHVDEFERLAKTLVHGPEFQIVLIDCESETDREALIAAVDDVARAVKLRTAKLPIGGRVADAAGLERRLRRQAAQSSIIHVLGAKAWFSPGRWADFNQRRERIARDARARLLLWLDGSALRDLSIYAPDIWAWRSGVYTFGLVSAVAVEAEFTLSWRTSRVPISGVDNRSLSERRERVAQLRSMLASAPSQSELRLPLINELAELHFGLGELDQALRVRREEELPALEQLGNARLKAVSMGRIADLLNAKGEFDEALRIYCDEVLPVFESVDDARSRAVTMGKIADVLEAQGRTDEGLRIRREHELPAYEKLGDVRARAVTMGRIADLLHERGQLDEALHLRRDEELPAYEQLGDSRARAVTMGRIADVLQARGQLEEALRLRREEELPTYEKLGETRLRAATMGKIADILQLRGQRDEAMRIRRDEEIPAYETLQLRRQQAIEKGKLADDLQGLGQNLGTVLRLRRSELPAYEEAGDLRAHTAALLKLASSLKKRGRMGDYDEARDLLRRALEDARKLKWVEAERRAKFLLDSLGPW